MSHIIKTLSTLALLAFAASASAQEAAIRKNLAERLQNFENIDEISKTPVNGLYEVRVNGADIFYTDAEGNFLIQGILFDTKARRNLTEERVDKLTAIKFESLPLTDAFAIVRGNGKRKLVVFEDPNCGYCKRFERDLQKIDNITVYMFLYPILGADSTEKSKAIWCSKDKGTAWQDWMLRDKPPAKPEGACDDAALTRNLAFARKFQINGTPALVFEDGTRVPGAIPAEQVEERLQRAQKKS